MGLAELCTYKYIIHGSGQTRGGSSAKMSCYQSKNTLAFITNARAIHQTSLLAVLRKQGKFYSIWFYPMFISTGREIPLTLPEPVYCQMLYL